MTRLFPLAALALPALPAMAQGVHETHRPVSMPMGKTVTLHRPVTRADCAAEHRHHQSGKMIYVPAGSDAKAQCEAAVAMRESARDKGR